MLQLAAKVVETLSVTRVILDETLNFQLFLPLPPSQCCLANRIMTKSLVYNIERGKGGEEGNLQLFCLSRSYFLGVSVFFFSVSTILRLIVAP